MNASNPRGTGDFQRMKNAQRQALPWVSKTRHDQEKWVCKMTTHAELGLFLWEEIWGRVQGIASCADPL